MENTFTAQDLQVRNGRGYAIMGVTNVSIACGPGYGKVICSTG